MTEKNKTSSPGTLTMALIVSKAKSDNLQMIRNLNLWGNDLEDLKLIRQMPNLKILSLSVNKISTLKDFSYCNELQQLFLRKNNISDIRQIKYLTKLPHLTELWLHDNPCAQIENYRQIVIKTLPRLTKLDNMQITNTDKARAQSINFNLYSYEQTTNQVSSNNNRDSYSNKKQLNQQFSKKFQEYQQNYEDQYETYQQKQDYKVPTANFQKQLSFPEKQQGPSKWKKQKQSPHITPAQKNKNILIAVVSLLKQLDQPSLQLVKSQVDKLLDY